MLENRNQALGRTSEDAACVYLRSLGFTVLKRNFRNPDGEIDIVAREVDMIVFVEVKARTTHSFGSALAAVDARKRKRLRAVAADFLQFFAPRAKARFDVLTLDAGRMTLHRNAFD